MSVQKLMWLNSHQMFVRQYAEVKACIAKNLPVISKHGVGYYQQRRKKNISTHCGPAVDPTGVGVPLPPGPEDPPPSSSSTLAAPAGKGKKRGRQGFTCAECGVTKYRKPDFEGHLWSKHGLRTPIVCNLGECENASYSSQSSLKQHIRTMHEKKLNSIVRNVNMELTIKTALHLTELTNINRNLSPSQEKKWSLNANSATRSSVHHIF